MEDKKIVSEDALRGALGVAADKTADNTALLAEANIRAFDGVIVNRNMLSYPTLKSGDIVYSEADNGFYTYIEQVGLDPLAADSLLPGGSVSTPKFSFMPYEDYMDGDAPSAAILYRDRSTATLYRYDADTASLVRYADAQTLTAELQAVRDEFAAENDRLSGLVDALAYAADQTEPGHTLGKAFREIGYTDAESVQGVLYSIEESKELAQEWEEGKRTTFKDCSSLLFAPFIDTSNVTSLQNLFASCSSMITLLLLDTSNVTNMSSMFSYCSNLTIVPLFDTSKVLNMYMMFNYCRSLKTIPSLDTSNVTNMRFMFQGCDSLTEIPTISTANVTSMEGMFFGCSSLTFIPSINTSKVMNMNSMFSGCPALTSIPALDTSKVTDIRSMFYGCSSLTAIPALDISNVMFMGSMFKDCRLLHTITLKGLGTYTNLTSIDFSPCLKWGTAGEASRQSLIDTLINFSYDRAGNGLSAATVKLHADTKALLTDEEKAQIVAKGFTIS